MQEGVTDEDRADLLTVLKFKFGSVDEETQARVAAITEATHIDHLILVAANPPLGRSSCKNSNNPAFV